MAKVVVTGIKELDDQLKQLPTKLQNKFVKGALRKGGKRVLKDFQRIVRAEAHDTGALEKSAKVIALKRSRERVGVAILPKSDVLFANYAARHDGQKPNPAKGETDPFYYAAAIEFGTKTQHAVRPARRSLYDNEDRIRRDFIEDVQQFISTGKVDYTLPK